MELVERAAEFAAIRDLVEACVSGRGGVLLVSGAAAVGKTALLRGFGACAEAAGVLFLQATASGAERSLPFGVMGQLLAAAEVSSPEVRVGVGRGGWNTTFGPDAAPVGGEATAESGSGAFAVDAFIGVCGVLMERSKGIPLVLCVDDIQHADAYSLECLLYVARRSETARIVVVLGESSSFLAGNPRFRSELLRLPSCRHLRLRPLTRRGVGRMLAAHGAERRADGLAGEFHRLSGGNPLLVRALLDDHRPHGAETGGPGASGAPGGPRAASGALVLGPAFEQAVTTCLYRCDSTLRHVAWAHAVLGPDAWDVTEADVLSITPEVVRRSLHALDETGLFSAGRLRHEAIRPAVLRSMDPAYRARLEARAARALHDRGASVTAQARHLVEAEPFEAGWVLPTLLEAADRALAEDETYFALECMRAARDRCPDARQSLEIKALLMRAGWRAGPAAGQLSELTAAALAGRLGAGDITALIGHLLWFGRLDQALAVLDEAERRGAGTGTEPSAAAGTGTGAGAGTKTGTGTGSGIRASTGPDTDTDTDTGAGTTTGNEEGDGVRGDGVRLGGEVAVARVRGAGPPDRRGLGVVRLSLAVGFPGLYPVPVGMKAALVGLLPRTRGMAARAAELLIDVMDGPIGEDGTRDAVAARAERMLQVTRMDNDTLPVLLVALTALVVVDDLGSAHSWCGLLVKEAEERRAPMWQALFMAAQAVVATRSGALADAHEAVRAALALVPAEGWGVAVAVPLAAALFAEAAGGDLTEAAARLVDPVPEAAFHTWGGVLYLSARGHYHLAAGRPYAAFDDFLECGRLVGRWGLDRPEMLPWRSDAARACLALGEVRRARGLVEEELTRTGGPRSWARGAALRVLAATVPVRRRPALLDEAVDILSERGHRYELARATEDLARAHRELGNAGRARRLARTARRLLQACGVEHPAGEESPEQPPEGTGADGGAEAATHERPVPPADGARPQRPQPVDELSDAELRVATLAASGHTNRQIAEQLFITVSTVEQHLTRVYRKLNVRRRMGLAKLLRHGSA